MNKKIMLMMALGFSSVAYSSTVGDAVLKAAKDTVKEEIKNKAEEKAYQVALNFAKKVVYATGGWPANLLKKIVYFKTIGAVKAGLFNLTIWSAIVIAAKVLYDKYKVHLKRLKEKAAIEEILGKLDKQFKEEADHASTSLEEVVDEVAEVAGGVKEEAEKVIENIINKVK